MHKIYIDHGVFIFIYQIPNILYSTIISAIISFIIKFLSLSQKNIIKIKEMKTYEESSKTLDGLLKCLKIKFILYFILSFLLLICFWYYLGTFCAVYKNTQIYLIKDTLISFATSMIYPFVINLIPGLFRLPAIKDDKKNKECLYNFSKIIQLI